MRVAVHEERTRPWLDVLVLTLAVGLAVLPLTPVYGLAAVVPPLLGGLVLGAGTAWFAVHRGWGVLVTAAVTLTVYLLAGTALAAPTLAVLRVLPSPDSLAQLLTGTITVWKEVLTLDPSLGSSGTLLVAPYLLALAGTAVAVGVALRARPRRRAVWATLVPVVVLGVAVLLGTKETVRPVVAGLVGLVVVLVWVSWRAGRLARRRIVSLTALVAVIAVAGAVGGPALGEQHPRFVLRDELVPPFDPRDHPSPLSAFRKFVKEWEETDLVTARGLPEGAVVRLATLDAFDGVVWNVAGAEAAEGSGSFRRVGETIETSVRGERATVELEVHELPMVWLPSVGYAQRFDFHGPAALDLSADLRYNDATGTAVLTDGVPAGTRYRLETVVPEPPSDDEIGAARAGSVTLPQTQAVPDAVPLFAGEIAGTATSPVLIARTLEQGLAERGWFSHGNVANDDHPSLSGHGADRITTLLTGELMVGDGEQYASAMALMAREMGLPARVVLGFAPPDPEDGAEGVGAAAGDTAEITFTGDDIEAWVEIAFQGHGWVRFDPTPPETRTPSDETPEEESEPQPQVRQPPPPPEDPVTPPDDDTEQPRTEDTPEEIETPSIWREVVAAVAVVGIPLILLVLPFMLIARAKRRRRERRRTAGPTTARVAGGWDEVVDHARDLRRPPPTTATRREAAVHLARAFASVPHRGRAPAGGDGTRRAGRVGAPVAGLAAGADALIFGPGEPSPEQVEAYWREVDGAVGAMRGAVTWRQRLRGTFSLASLRARRRR